MKKVLILIISLLTFYLYDSSDIRAVPSDLLTMAEQLKHASIAQESIMLSIKDNDDETIRRMMNKNNINHILFYKQGEQISITFNINRWLHWFRPKRYFKFSLNGYTEEYQVDSIKKSIADHPHDFYHFCEKLDREKWFYCEAKD